MWALQKAVFAIIRQSKHIVMSNGLRTVTVPRHTTINALTMGKIAKDAGYTPEQFRTLLRENALVAVEDGKYLAFRAVSPLAAPQP